jgi:flagellar biosynthetic protein FliQ
MDDKRAAAAGRSMVNRGFTLSPSPAAGIGKERVGTMSGVEVLDLGREAIWLTVIIAAPVMLVGLAVGFGVSLLQTLTQIQEQTLVFVPKIISIFLALLLFMPIMGGLLGKFMQDIFIRVASY